MVSAPHAWLPPTIDYPYKYEAQVIGVVDGDTQDFVAHWESDIGFRIKVTQQYGLRCRLIGVNTPEKKGATYAAGIEAQKFVQQWLAANAPGSWVNLVTFKDKGDKYGRYLAEVWDLSWDNCLNSALLVSGNAVEYWP